MLCQLQLCSKVARIYTYCSPDSPPVWVTTKHWIESLLFLSFSLALKCRVPYYLINNIFNYSTISKCGRNLHAFFPCYFLLQFKWPGVGSQVNRFIQPPRIGITFRRLEIRGNSKLEPREPKEHMLNGKKNTYMHVSREMSHSHPPAVQWLRSIEPNQRSAKKVTKVHTVGLLQTPGAESTGGARCVHKVTQKY